jgi:hypothetical protein
MPPFNDDKMIWPLLQVVGTCLEVAAPLLLSFILVIAADRRKRRAVLLWCLAPALIGPCVSVWVILSVMGDMLAPVDGLRELLVALAAVGVVPFLFCLWALLAARSVRHSSKDQLPSHK